MVLEPCQTYSKANKDVKLFKCQYNWYGPYGCFQEYNVIVVAESETVALGVLLQDYLGEPKDWTIEEIDINVDIPYSILISERG